MRFAFKFKQNDYGAVVISCLTQLLVYSRLPEAHDMSNFSSMSFI